jgi:hypothetical protein
MPEEFMPKKMANCPNCSKPILSEATLISPSNFMLLCPHCLSKLRVSIQPKITVTAIAGKESRDKDRDKEKTKIIDLPKVAWHPKFS